VALLVVLAVEQRGRHPQPQPPPLVAERAARQHAQAVLPQEQRGQALVTGDAVPPLQHVRDRGEVRVQVERRLRRRHRHAGRREPERHLAGHPGVQAAAERDPFGQRRRLAERDRGGLLHGAGRCRPDLAADPEQPAAQLAAEPSAGQPGHAEAPAPQSKVLAQARGHHGPFGRNASWTGDVGHLVVDEVPVDLVRDDDQPVPFGDRAQRAHGARRGLGPGRIVGQRDDDRTDRAAGRTRHRYGASQLPRVRHAARAGHEVRGPAGQAGLRAVADPARPGDRDVAADRRDQAEQQRLAARAGHDRLGVGGQAAPAPVGGGSLAQRGVAGHRAVGRAARGVGQRLAQHRVGGQPRLAERHRQHGLAAAAAFVQGLVGGQRGGDRYGDRAELGIAGAGGRAGAQRRRGDSHGSWHS